jgi:hypothetical protein
MKRPSMRRANLEIIFLSSLAAIAALTVAIPALYHTRVYDDAFNYVAPARDLVAGQHGLIDYSGTPYVKWAPLYPTFLSLLAIVFDKDPLLLGYLANAAFFGIIVYLGGALAFLYLSNSPVLAVLGALAILVSLPLFEVSIQVWSEPLFIVLTLLSLFFLHQYLSSNSSVALVVFSIAVSLACLQRYAGLSLALWGALTVCYLTHGDVRDKILRTSIFVVIAFGPIGAWVIRNQLVAGGTLAPREPPIRNFFANLRLAIDEVSKWYIFGDRRGIIFASFLTSLALISFIGYTKKSCSNFSYDHYIAKAVYIILSSFCVIYLGFVIGACTLTQCVPWSRTLSPVYIPLTILIFLLLGGILRAFLGSTLQNVGLRVLMLAFVIWLCYPIGANISSADYFIKLAHKLNSASWKSSETVNYLRRHPDMRSSCDFYTNDVAATFVLAYINADRSLNSWGEGTLHKTLDSGVSPRKREKTCLVWYDHPSKLDYFALGEDYYTFSELQGVVNLDLIVRLGDGAIYVISKK